MGAHAVFASDGYSIEDFLAFTESRPDGEKWELARIRLGTLLNAVGDDKLRKILSPYNQYPNPAGYPTVYDGKRY